MPSQLSRSYQGEPMGRRRGGVGVKVTGRRVHAEELASCWMERSTSVHNMLNSRSCDDEWVSTEWASNFFLWLPDPPVFWEESFTFIMAVYAICVCVCHCVCVCVRESEKEREPYSCMQGITWKLEHLLFCSGFYLFWLGLYFLSLNIYSMVFSFIGCKETIGTKQDIPRSAVF